MSRLRFRIPSRSMLVALVALGVALGGQDAYATVKTFMLGTANTSDAPTTVTAASTWPTSGGQRLFQFTNTNTTTGATALGLHVASGHAPFTVNSSTKVTNLNADQLDGKDSTAFYPSANVVRMNAPTIAANTAVGWTLGDLLLSYQCAGDGNGGVGLTGVAENLATSAAVYQGTIQDWNNDGTSHATTYIHRFSFPGRASSGGVSQAGVPAGVVARQIHTFVWFTGSDTITGSVEIYLDGTADICQVEGIMTRAT